MGIADILVGILRQQGCWRSGKSKEILSALKRGERFRYTMNYHGIEISRRAIKAFCRRHHIHRLALFGSILREDFGPKSDIDVLVAFEPGHVPGLLRMASLEIELSEILGRKAAVRTAAELSRHFREDVLKEAQYVLAG